MSVASVQALISVRSRGVLPMIAAFVRAYPGRSAAALAAVFVEGVS